MYLVSLFNPGFFFGKTPLIQLSPKKTWEGFLGAFASSLIWAFFFSRYLSQFEYMICPMNNPVCIPNPVFYPYTQKLYALDLILQMFGYKAPTVSLLPIQYHALIMATFASLIAPFGGFFASGMKRAFKIKDFGDSIPGHGGVTDRMDCQLMMGLFSYMYFQSFIGGNVTSGQILHQALGSLSLKELVELHKNLGDYLQSQGLLDQIK